MTIPLASLVDLLSNPAARQRNDQSTHDELTTHAARLSLPAGLRVQWLGTAGFRFSYAGFDLLIDPYLSRPGLKHVLSRRVLQSRADRIDDAVERADAILVGHTHFDHALDVPALARRHRAHTYGSSSLATLMALHDLADLCTVVKANRVYEVGPFEVTFVPSVHSKLVLGLAVNSGGELTCDHLDHLSGNAYRCGQVWGIHLKVGGVTFYHQGSANLIDDAIIHRNVDVFLAGIAGRGFTRDYTQRILKRLSPRVIVPHHYDDFFHPLQRDAQQLRFSLNVNLGGFVEEAQRVSKDFEIVTLQPLRTLGGQ